MDFVLRVLARVSQHACTETTTQLHHTSHRLLHSPWSARQSAQRLPVDSGNFKMRFDWRVTLTVGGAAAGPCAGDILADRDN
jgi:hypothetical protein